MGWVLTWPSSSSPWRMQTGSLISSLYWWPLFGCDWSLHGSTSFWCDLAILAHVNMLCVPVEQEHYGSHAGCGSLSLPSLVILRRVIWQAIGHLDWIKKKVMHFLNTCNAFNNMSQTEIPQLQYLTLLFQCCSSAQGVYRDSDAANSSFPGSVSSWLLSEGKLLRGFVQTSHSNLILTGLSFGHLYNICWPHYPTLSSFDIVLVAKKVQYCNEIHYCCASHSL